MNLQITEEQIIELLKKVSELEKNNTILTTLTIVFGILIFVIGMAFVINGFVNEITEKK